MTDANATPAWMNFVNFDGRLTGETARKAKETAEARGWTVHELLTHIIAGGLQVEADVNDACLPVTEEWAKPVANDVTVEPMTINAGNGGFHVVTVVADGYGYLVAEDQDGAEKARVEVAEHTDDAAADLVALMRAWQPVAERDGS